MGRDQNHQFRACRARFPIAEQAIRQGRYLSRFTEAREDDTLPVSQSEVGHHLTDP